MNATTYANYPRLDIVDYSPEAGVVSEYSELSNTEYPNQKPMSFPWPEMCHLTAKITWLCTKFTAINHLVVISPRYDCQYPILAKMFNLTFDLRDSPPTTEDYSKWKESGSVGLCFDNTTDVATILAYINQIAPTSTIAVMNVGDSKDTISFPTGEIHLQAFCEVGSTETFVIISSDGSNNISSYRKEWYLRMVAHHNRVTRNNGDQRSVVVWRNPITSKINKPEDMDAGYDVAYLFQALKYYLQSAGMAEDVTKAYEQSLSLLEHIKLSLVEAGCSERSLRDMSSGDLSLSMGKSLTFTKESIYFNFNKDERMAYQSGIGKYEKTKIADIGQIKLFLGELAFFIDKALSIEGEYTIVVAGGHVGVHYIPLLSMYTGMKVELWDPQFAVEAEQGHEHMVLKLAKIHGIATGRIKIVGSIFTNDDARAYAAAYSDSKSSLVFVSDIRSTGKDSNYASSENINADNQMQLEWINIMKPKHCLLKFAVPWAKDESDSRSLSYPNGTVYKQVWQKQGGAETRLSPELTSNGYVMVNYPYLAYEQCLMHYNHYVRDCRGIYETEFLNPITGARIMEQDFVGNYDCAYAIYILDRYFAVKDKKLPNPASRYNNVLQLWKKCLDMVYTGTIASKRR